MDFPHYNNNNNQSFVISGSGGGGGSGGNTKRKKSNPNYHDNDDTNNPPIRQRSQANARERDRTHSVNTAFSTLRTLIPTEPKDRKLSKIETLRLASSYISHLGTQLIAGPIDQPCLRLSRIDDDTNNRYQVCTFCIAHRKSPRNDGFNCNYDEIYLNTPTTTNTTTGNELTTIYYQ